jgi:23S rRNA (adenine2503-C2)-methyltransferase
MATGSLSELSADEILSIIEPAGYKYSHALSVANGIYKKQCNDIGSLDRIPSKLRILLEENYISGIFPPVNSEKSEDGTVKYLFSSAGGKLYETVYIPDQKRNTVCVSTQSGCRMGCTFCVTGSYGFHGDLTAGEIVNQVLAIPEAGRITHVVMMGMGEPMDNIDNVLKACGIMTASWGMSISQRNITVSTVGLLPGIRKFLTDSKCNLTLSLFSPFHDERKIMAPVENRYPAANILKMLRNFPAGKRRRFSLAYVMIKDINDTDEHLAGLKDLAAGSRIRINLLPFHPPGNVHRVSSSPEKMMHFKHELVTCGISASIRRSRGADISAACGLLASALVTRH